LGYHPNNDKFAKKNSGVRVNSLTTMIMEALKQHGGLNYDVVAKKTLLFQRK
jgi:hypothetical protein